MKISPEPGLPKRKVGLHEQITVEKEAFTQNSNVFFFFASYTGTMPTILLRVNEWDFPLTGSRKVLFVSELTLHLPDDDVLCKQTLAQAGSRRKYPEQTWWAHIWAIETNSQDLLTQIRNTNIPPCHILQLYYIYANKLYMRHCPGGKHSLYHSGCGQHEFAVWGADMYPFRSYWPLMLKLLF